MTMQKSILVFLSLALSGLGRRVQNANAASEVPVPSEASGALIALASLLAPGNSVSAAFQIASAGALRSPTWARGQNVLGRRMPVCSMSDEEEEEAELSSDEAIEDTPDLEKLSPSITEDLLDSLFGDESLMTPAGQEVEEIAEQLDEDQLEAQMAQDAQIDEWVEAMEDEAKMLDAATTGDFAKGYEEVWAKEARLSRAEKEQQMAEENAELAARRGGNAEEEKGEEQQSDLAKSLEEVPDQLEFIRSMVNHNELQKTREAWRLNDQDVGSTAVQIATLTKRIAFLTQHIQQSRKDISGLRGLNKLVNKRRKLLEYLLRTNRDEFDRVTSGLGIRTTKLTLPKLPGARGIQQLARVEGRLAPKLSPKDKQALKDAKAAEIQAQLGLGKKKEQMV